jgi:hypothetical protein
VFSKAGRRAMGSLAVSADVTPVLDDIVHSSRLLQDYLSLERGSPQDSQGLTRHKISDREPGATYHGAKMWMANTQEVNRTFARGSLHRLVRCCRPPPFQPTVRAKQGR